MKKDVQFRQQWPLPHMENPQGTGGLLPMTKEAAALWNFLQGAMAAIAKIPAQTTLEGAPDANVSLIQIATSVAQVYGVKTEDMFNMGLVHCAKREAARCGLVWFDQLDAWIASGGKAYNDLTRDPDKVFQ